MAIALPVGSASTCAVHSACRLDADVGDPAAVCTAGLQIARSLKTARKTQDDVLSADAQNSTRPQTAGEHAAATVSP